MWFPYIFANINNTGFEFLPGYDSRWGAYLQTAYSFPDRFGRQHRWQGPFRLCAPSLAPPFGFDAKFKYGKDNRSFGDLVTYYAFDDQPDRNVGGPGEPDEPGKSGRYRVTFKHRLFVTDDIYVTADINLLSDVDFLEDFYPNEFRLDPQPDTYLSVTKWDEFYTLNLIGRWQMNDFQDTTERLPELVLDVKQHRIFGLPFFYDGESSVGSYRRAFSYEPEFGEEDFPNYSATRFDTFHQLSLPNQFFGWLNITPRMGFRATYYSESGTFLDFDGTTTEFDPDSGRMVQTIPGPSIESTPLNSPTPTLQSKGADLPARREFRCGGLHQVVQGLMSAFSPGPSASMGSGTSCSRTSNYSFVYNFGPSPQDILQFDRVVPSTQLLPLDFPAVHRHRYHRHLEHHAPRRAQSSPDPPRPEHLPVDDPRIRSWM